MLTTILIISVIIVLIVLFLAVITTSKAYSYKHTVDPISTNQKSNDDKKDSQD
ncbi:YtzI protein [Bacillus sp. CGMCC 1.16607]|uniref:YtzI protein n=1 Tax=Bacillus sp. CGMCC 1.16607 TaxID=3351842 RepID=UPI0036370564